MVEHHAPVLQTLMSSSTSTTTLSLSRSHSEDSPPMIDSVDMESVLERLSIDEDGGTCDDSSGKGKERMLDDEDGDSSSVNGAANVRDPLLVLRSPRAGGVDRNSGAGEASLRTRENLAVALFEHPAPVPHELCEYRVVVDSDWKFEAELEPTIDWNAVGMCRALCGMRGLPGGVLCAWVARSDTVGLHRSIWLGTWASLSVNKLGCSSTKILFLL